MIDLKVVRIYDIFGLNVGISAFDLIALLESRLDSNLLGRGIPLTDYTNNFIPSLL